MEKMCQIILADANEQIPGANGAVINKLVQPVLTFRLPFVPSALSFHLMFITSGYEYNNGLDFRFEIIDPDNNKIFDSENQRIPSIGQKFDNFNLNTDIKNVSIMKQGVYTIKASIGGKEYCQKFTIVSETEYKYAT